MAEEKTSPIYLANITVGPKRILNHKTKKASQAKWPDKTIELVYKKRFKDDNDDEYLLNRIRMEIGFTKKEQIIIKKVELKKYITEGKYEFNEENT